MQNLQWDIYIQTPIIQTRTGPEQKFDLWKVFFSEFGTRWTYSQIPIIQTRTGPEQKFDLWKVFFLWIWYKVDRNSNQARERNLVFLLLGRMKEAVTKKQIKIISSIKLEIAINRNLTYLF